MQSSNHLYRKPNQSANLNNCLDKVLLLCPSTSAWTCETLHFTLDLNPWSKYSLKNRRTLKMESRNEVRDVSSPLRCVHGVDSEWGFTMGIDSDSSQPEAWLGGLWRRESRCTQLTESGMEETSGLVSDMEGWPEESCVEAQNCFVVEGIYETTCMCIWTLVDVNSKPQMCSGMPNKMSFKFKKLLRLVNIWW